MRRGDDAEGDARCLDVRRDTSSPGGRGSHGCGRPVRGRTGLALSLLSTGITVGGLAILVESHHALTSALSAGETTVALSSSHEVPGAGQGAIVSGGFTSARVVLTGLDDLTRLLLATSAAAHLVGLVSMLILAASVGLALIPGRRPTAPVAKIAVAAAAVSIAASLMSSIIGAMAQDRVATVLNRVDDSVLYGAQPFEPTDLLITSAIVAIAIVWRRGVGAGTEAGRSAAA